MLTIYNNQKRNEDRRFRALLVAITGNKEFLEESPLDPEEAQLSERDRSAMELSRRFAALGV